MGVRRVRIIRMFKLMTILFLVGTVIVIGVSMFRHAERKLEVPRKFEEIGQDKVEKQAKIEHFESEGESEKIELKADEHFMGDDGLYHIKGHVEVVFPKRRKGNDVFLYGDEIVYDKEYSRFSLRGSGRVVYEDLTVESDALNFDNKGEVFTTDQSLRFSTKRLSGKAQSMAYWMQEERIELRRDVSLDLISTLDPDQPIKISGDRFHYAKDRRRGIVEGHVQLKHGGSEASASLVDFSLFPDTDEIQSLFLVGNAEARLEEGGQDIPTRWIAAEEMTIRAHPDTPKIQSVEARKGCDFSSVSSSGDRRRVRAELLKFVLSQTDELREFHAESRVLMTEMKQGERRVIEGESLFFEAGKQALLVEGIPERRALIRLQDREIEADEIVLFQQNDDLSAKGQVKVMFRSPGEEDRAIAFFSKRRPVFVTANEVRYSSQSNRFIFKTDIEEPVVKKAAIKKSTIKKPEIKKPAVLETDIKVWQEQMTLNAQEMSLDRETGGVVCRGGVRTVIPYTPKDRGEERVEIMGEELRFNPDERILSYKKEASLKAQNILLRAQTIAVLLGGEEGNMTQITAQGKVVIIQDENEGRGKKALYDVAEETIILTGKPIFIDKDKGQTGGDKLTFHIADGRIIVENKGRERSVTVIK